MDELIFGELSKQETQILKLLSLHLTMGRLKLSKYMEEHGKELDSHILHLEREDLITSKHDPIGRQPIYCCTTRGLEIARHS